MSQSKNNKHQSKETWNKVIDFVTFHDPKSNKAKEIKKDVSGYFGLLPIVIGFAIIIATSVLYFFILWLVQD